MSHPPLITPVDGNLNFASGSTCAYEMNSPAGTGDLQVVQGGGDNSVTPLADSHFISLSLTAIPEVGGWLGLACLIGCGVFLRGRPPTPGEAGRR